TFQDALVGASCLRDFALLQQGVTQAKVSSFQIVRRDVTVVTGGIVASSKSEPQINKRIGAWKSSRDRKASAVIECCVKGVDTVLITFILDIEHGREHPALHETMHGRVAQCVLPKWLKTLVKQPSAIHAHSANYLRLRNVRASKNCRNDPMVRFERRCFVHVV